LNREKHVSKLCTAGITGHFVVFVPKLKRLTGQQLNSKGDCKMFNQSTAPAHEVISRIPVPGKKAAKLKFNVTEATREKTRALARYVLVFIAGFLVFSGLIAVYKKFPDYEFVASLCRYLAQ